jgi:hypothetical protein
VQADALAKAGAMTKRALAELGVACTRRIPLGTARRAHGRRRLSFSRSKAARALQLGTTGADVQLG